MLEESHQTHEAPTSSRVAFEVVNGETPLAERVAIGESLCSKSQGENELSGTDIGLPDIESIVRVVATEHSSPTIVPSVQQVD